MNLLALLAALLLAAPGTSPDARGMAAGAPGSQERPPERAVSTAGATPAREPQAKPLRCVTPGGEAVSAEAVMRDLRDGKDVQLKGRLIEGSLYADAVWPPGDERKISLRVIPGSLHLESCRIAGSVLLARCVFMKGLEIPCTEIRGDLDLSDSEIRGGFSAASAHLMGPARLGRLSVMGSISFAGATIEERVDLGGIRASGHLDFNGGEFHHDLELSRAIVQDFDLSAAEITGQSTLQDLLVLGNLEGHETNFGKGLVIEGVRVVGRLDLSGARGTGGVSVSECFVGSDLFLDLAGGGPLTIAGIEVGRDLSLLDGVFGPVTMERMRVKRRCEIEGARFQGRVAITDSDLGSEFSASEAWFRGECELKRVRIPGDDPMEGVRFARAPTLIDTVLPRPPAVEPEGEGEDEEPPPEEDDEDDSP